ncbi:hypothetical protein [Streptomyces sp. NPDC050560]|uniref:hypothetical protein n=1 Tax=Streptomyces sp. NPDC050560 TaxID=3365630 RepID=UPI0037B85E27
MTRSAATLAVVAAAIVPLSGVASATEEPRTGHHHECSCFSADAWLVGGKGFYNNLGGPAGITNAGGAFIAGGESIKG